MTDKKDLYYLEELSDYKVASDYPDVRGWDVVDADERNVGKVTNLLVSKEQERVIYLDVEVDKAVIEEGYRTYETPAGEGVHGFLNKEGEDHIIVPIGMADLNEGHKKVLVREINHATFTGAKRFSKGTAIDRDYELSLYRHYTRNEKAATTDMDEKWYKKTR